MGRSSVNDKRKTILLVDDEALIAMSEKADLEKYGYDVVIELSGEKAIETAKENNGIDLILMDIDLGGGIDGTVAAEEILKERDIPVVFFSSHTQPEIVEKTEKITSYGYVVKDSGITVLDASIKMAFRLFESRKSLYGANENLRHHSQLLENIIENFPGFVLWKDPESVFLGCNTNFAKKCGFSLPSEIIGKCDHDLPFFKEEVETFLEDDRKVMRTGEAKMHFEEREHVAHGEEIFLDTCKIPLYDAEGKVSGILAVAMDITGHKRIEDEVRRTNENLQKQKKSLSILNEIISLANNAEDYHSLFKNILEGSISLLDYDAGGIYIVDPDGSTARMIHSQNLSPEFLAETGTVPTGKPPYDTLFIKGAPIITDHYESISPERASSSGICSLVSVPIFLKDRVTGALNLASKRRYVVSDDEKKTLSAIGLELGSLIKRMKSEDESKRAARNFETLFNSVDEMVFILDMDGRIMRVN
ncbi:MAG: PAS domain-containing protein, partial [Spirochaetes bacterium]|nr:PAS domain-containing protein [Spirochaetota bacterium]